MSAGKQHATLIYVVMSLYEVADLPLLRCAPPPLDALEKPGKDDCSRCGLWSDRGCLWRRSADDISHKYVRPFALRRSCGISLERRAIRA